MLPFTAVVVSIVMVILAVAAPLAARTKTQQGNAASSPGGATVSGTATDGNGGMLANYTVRLRNLATGNTAGTTTTTAGGQFSFAGLDPGNYVVEIVDQAGAIVGTSPALAVVEGTAVTVTVGSGAAAAAAAAGAGGVFLTSAAGLVTMAAVGAGITAIAVTSNRGTASPSR